MEKWILSLGDKIFLLRKKLKLNQYDLAEKAGVSPLTISRIESNQVYPHPSTLKTIADVLGISIEELRGE